MTLSISVLMLVAALTLSLFLAFANLLFWRNNHDDRTPLWLAAWLGASAVYAFCRLLQYAPLPESLSVLVPRILLSSAYALAWLGYELGNSFIGYRPRRWERNSVIAAVALLLLLLWFTDLILTSQSLTRTITLGGQFHGVKTGPLYLLASLVILGLGVIPFFRLLRAANSQNRENLLMAMGYGVVILFSLVDFVATALNLGWIRLSDFGYLPVAIFYSLIQVQRQGRLYREMNVMIRERTRDLTQANETLGRREERYRRLFEDSPLPMWIYDRKTLFFLDVNGAAIEKYGYSREDFLHMTIAEIRPVDEVQRLLENLATERADLQHSGIWRHELRDGSIIKVEISSHLLDLEGQQAALVVAQDVTERLRAEEQAHLSQQRLAGLVNSAMDGVISINSGHEIVLFNPAAEKMFGYEAAEVAGRPLNTLIPETFHTDHARHIDNFGETGITARSMQGFSQVIGKGKDGREFPLEASISVAKIGGERLFTAILRDVSARQKAEAALRESEEKYRTLVENANDGITIIQNGAVKYANPRLAEMRGESIVEIVGQRFDKYIQPDERSKIWKRYRRRLAGQGETATYELSLVRKDGSIVLVELAAGLITYQGAPAEIIIIRDISERKLAEQALQRQLQEMIVLNTVAAAGAEATDIDELIERVTNIIAGTLYQDNCGVLLAEQSSQSWHPHASYRGAHAKGAAGYHPFSEGIAGKVISTGEAVLVGNIGEEPAYMEVTGGIQSELAVPIIVNGTVFGCLNAESRGLATFSEHDERLMNTISGSMSTAISKILLLQAEKERREEAEILFNTTRDLVVEQDLSKLLCTIVERAVAMLGASSGGLYLCEPEQRQVRCVVNYNIPQDFTGVTLKYGEGAAGTVAETGEPLIIEDYRVWEGRAAVYEEAQPFTSLLSVPMRWQDRVVGVIHVLESSKLRTFSQEDLQVLTLFANQATVALENSRLLDETRRRADEFAVLYETTRDLAAQRELDVLLEAIVERATTLLAASTGAIFLYNESRNNLYIAVAKGFQFPADTNVEMGEGMAGRVAETRQPLIVNNYSAWEDRSSKYDGIPMTASLQVPMLYGGKLIGVLDVSELHNTTRRFGEEDMRLLTLFGGQAAIAIENSRLLETEQRRRREADAIAEIGRDISQTLELDLVLERIASHAKNLLGVETSAVYLPEPGSRILRAVAAIGPDAEYIKEYPLQLGVGILAKIALQKSGEIVNDASADPRGVNIEGTETIPFENLMGVPVLSKGELAGLIAVWRTGPGQEFHARELDFLSALAQQVGVAIENARLFEQTRRRLVEIEGLHTVSTALRSAQTLDEALPIILDQLIELMNAGSALVDLLDPSTSEIVTELARGAWAPVTGLRTPKEAGITGLVMASGNPYVSADVIEDGLVFRPELVSGMNATACVPIIAQHQPIGTLWIGRQTRILDEEISLLAAIGEMVGTAIHRMRLHAETERLFEDLQVANAELSQAYDTTLEGWAKALELRDKETEGHSRRVTELSLRLAEAMGISEPELTHMRRGVLLHDIGKMGVTDQLLRKTGPLTSEEWAEMRKHPQYAYDLLSPITYLRSALDIPYCHHERWDGTGYPRGLKGEEIPLAARVFAVVDVYDALFSDRPYRSAWPRRKVINYLRDQSGKHFDPDVVDAFMRLISDKRLVSQQVSAAS